MTTPAGNITHQASGSAAARELEQLIPQVAKWGMEVGFLNLEDHVEPRLEALVCDSSQKVFGDCEAELDRIQSTLESSETEWNAATRVVAGYRARYGTRAEAPKSGLVRRLREWIWAYREYRAAGSVCRRLEPELQKVRLELDAAVNTRNAAVDWRKRASEALLANYEFQKTRAAVARPVQENSHDIRETRNFIVHRAN